MICAESEPREPPDQARPPKGRTRRRRWLRRVFRIILVVAIALPALWTYARFGRLNFHTVVPGQVYRSAQPTPGRFRGWAAEHGFRTVINLRGGQDRPEVQAVIRAAEEMGVETIILRLPNKRLPEPAVVRRLVETIESAPQPMLLHCRAGADRSGVAGAIAAMAIGHQSFDQARRQLSPYYLHLDPFPHHVGALLTLYEEYCREQGRPTGGWGSFRAWALGPYAEMERFEKPREATASLPTKPAREPQREGAEVSEGVSR